MDEIMDFLAKNEVEDLLKQEDNLCQMVCGALEVSADYKKRLELIYKIIYEVYHLGYDEGYDMAEGEYFSDQEESEK